MLWCIQPGHPKYGIISVPPKNDVIKPYFERVILIAAQLMHMLVRAIIQRFACHRSVGTRTIQNTTEQNFIATAKQLREAGANGQCSPPNHFVDKKNSPILLGIGSAQFFPCLC